MHAYVVFAHPTRRSFTGAVLEALCRGLDEGGHTFEVGDLSAMDTGDALKDAQTTARARERDGANTHRLGLIVSLMLSIAGMILTETSLSSCGWACGPSRRIPNACLRRGNSPF